MASDVWHDTDKCAINGVELPRGSRTAGQVCPFCGNIVGALFDGSPKAGFDPQHGATPSTPKRPASTYAAAVGIFFLVNIVVILGLSFFTPANAGAVRGFLGLLLGGFAVWWYLQTH